MSNRSSILIINDVTGYGRVSTFAMMPILAHKGLHPYVLPTSLVSNTMDYGSAEILDTTEFMKKTISKWKEFGFSFKNITTGFINSAEQVDIICDLIDSQDSPFVMVDPIMADSGELYPGMYEGAIESNRKLASRADLIIPNFTEATMLADLYLGRTELTDSEYSELVDKLLELGPDNIVITGCRDTDGNTFNLVQEHGADAFSKICFDRISQDFIGTGDIFSACLLSNLMSRKNLTESVSRASDFVRAVIIDNLDNPDHFDIILEKSLYML